MVIHNLTIIIKNKDDCRIIHVIFHFLVHGSVGTKYKLAINVPTKIVCVTISRILIKDNLSKVNGWVT